jgi:hypothetical protein
MTATPGADERRTRANLLRILNGPPASTPPPAPPAPGRPRGDWWERLYDEEQGDHGGAAPKQRRMPPVRKEPASEPGWEDAEPDDESTPAARRRTTHSPGRRLHAAYLDLAPRTRVLLYNGAAAGLGWAFGLVPLFERWITSCQHDTGHISAALVLGAGLALACGILIDRRSRRWWGPLPWICRIPTASAVLALALYAPASTL